MFDHSRRLWQTRTPIRGAGESRRCPAAPWARRAGGAAVRRPGRCPLIRAPRPPQPCETRVCVRRFERAASGKAASSRRPSPSFPAICDGRVRRFARLSSRAADLMQGHVSRTSAFARICRASGRPSRYRRADRYRNVATRLRHRLRTPHAPVPRLGGAGQSEATSVADSSGTGRIKPIQVASPPSIRASPDRPPFSCKLQGCCSGLL